MKTIVLEDHEVETLVDLFRRSDLVRQLRAPDNYVAVHKEDDLPLILELLDSERETAEQQLCDYENNHPGFVPDARVRLTVATEVYDRLKEQL